MWCFSEQTKGNGKRIKRKEKKKEDKRSKEKRGISKREKQQEIKGRTNKMKSNFCIMRAMDKVDEASVVIDQLQIQRERKTEIRGGRGEGERCRIYTKNNL